MTPPLEGIRVLDLTRGMPGAIATMLLADYGADVVVVQDGSPQRRAYDWLSTRTWDRGKRRAVVDLGDGRSRSQVVELAGGADVVVVELDEDHRALGLGPDEITAVNPDVIYTAITGFGLEDPGEVPALEVLAAAELGAMLAVPAIHRDGPVYPGHPAIAYSTAFVAVIGILAALRARIAGGDGDVLDVSLRDGVLGQFTMNWWTERKVASMSSRTSDGQLDLGSIRMIVRRYRCRDGRQIGVHTGANGAFTRLMKLLGLEDQVSPVDGPVESACPLTDRDKEILDTLPDIFATKTADQWLRDIWANEIAALPVLPPGEVFDDGQVIHNGLIRTIDDPELGTLTVVGAPIRMAGSPAQVNEPIETLVDIDTQVWRGSGLPEGGDADLAAGPLDGIRVVEMSTFFAAPYANRFLRDLGADVVKIEPTSGDPMRSLPDPFANVAKGKRSLAIDMKADGARPVIRELLRTADVVQHNFRPGAAERLGVDYESVRAMNPRVIYDYAPGYGSTGPKSMLQSFAPLLSGFVGMHTEAAGEGNDPVACFGNEDYYNGQLNAIGSLLALVHRERSGEGQYLECPQLSSAVFVTSHWYRADGRSRSSLPQLDHDQHGWSPYQRLYQCLEGWLCVFCSTGEERAALRREVLGTDRAGGDDDEQLAYKLFEQPAEAWVRQLRAAAVPCTVARETSWLHEFLLDEHSIAKEWATPTEHPDHGKVSIAGRIVRLQHAPRLGPTRAPLVGEHSLSILGEVGIDTQAATTLVEAGAVVAAAPVSAGAP